MTRIKSSPRLRAIDLAPLILILGPILSGCGSGDADVAEKPAPKKTVKAIAAAPAEPVAAQPAIPAVANVPTVPAVTAPAASEPASSADALPAGVSPQDLFRIVPPEEARPPAGERFSVTLPAEQRFVVVPPLPNSDSSLFQIVGRPAGIAQGVRTGMRPLPEGFQVLPEFGFAEDGAARRIRCERDGAEMVLIPAGLVTLGEENVPDSQPRITVEVGAYYIDRTETTLESFERYRTWSKEEKKRFVSEPANSGAAPSTPVLALTWREAQTFARWAGKELPTEAEWERAARGPQNFPYPWGTGRPLWPSARGQFQIDPAGSFRADVSPFGLVDVAGNAREWCQDWYSDQAFAEAAKSPMPLKDWTGPRAPSHQLRLVKGNGPDWNLGYRAGARMDERSLQIGLRCVLRLGAQPPAAVSRPLDVEP